MKFHPLRQPLPTVVRHACRTVQTALLAGVIVLTGAVLSAASADTPKDWEKAPDTSPLGFLLVLLIIPLGLFLVITLLTLLPSLASDKGYEPGQSWRGESEWFGGPTQGLAAADQVTHDQLQSSTSQTGGSSGRW